MSCRDGVTLLELLVTLLLLGIVAGVAGLAPQGAPAAPVLAPSAARVLAARDSALRSGHPVTIAIMQGGRWMDATALPDGRVAAAISLDVDPLSGRVGDAAP